MRKTTIAYEQGCNCCGERVETVEVIELDPKRERERRHERPARYRVHAGWRSRGFLADGTPVGELAPDHPDRRRETEVRDYCPRCRCPDEDVEAVAAQARRRKLEPCETCCQRS